MVTDTLGSEVGQLQDAVTGIVVRSVGDDRVMLYANANGFVQGPLFFFHQNAGCLGPRQLLNVNGHGMMFLGQVFGGSIVYSRVVDPGGAIALDAWAMETVETEQELSAGGACVAFTQPSSMSMGPAVVEADPAGSLVPPFRVR